MKKDRPSMTSVEAAALILSEGQTTDPEKAELIAAGQLLDPDGLEKAALRRAMGFDFDVTLNPKDRKAVVLDCELLFKTTCMWLEDDPEGNSARLSKACIKLKKMHDKAVADDSVR